MQPFFVFLSCLTLFAFVLVKELRFLIHYLQSFYTEKTSFFTWHMAGYHVLECLGIIGALYGFFIEPYWTEVNYISIVSEKIKSGKLRIIQISDIHCEETPVAEEKAET